MTMLCAAGSEKGRTDETLLQQATEASETLCHPEQPNKRRRVLSKKGAHYLEDPNLRLLRRALREVDIPCSTVKVASPLSGDTRQQPFAGNLLDLLLRGEGGVGRYEDGPCLAREEHLPGSVLPALP